MKKLVLAVGDTKFEDVLKERIENQREIVGYVKRRDAIINYLQQNECDEILISERIDGYLDPQNDILKIVYEIGEKFPGVRIIFIAGVRKPGDSLLAALVNYGVYDILFGENIKINDIVNLILEPSSYDKVRHLQPKPSLDEKKNKVSFEAPDPVIIEKKIENDKDNTENNKKEGLSIINRLLELKKKPEGSIAIKEKINTRQKIIGFMGSNFGVGSTNVAFNTSFLLMKKNHNVLYIELNWHNPSIPYIYQIDNLLTGIDFLLNPQTAINANESLINMKNYHNDSVFQGFKGNLDVLTFSSDKKNIHESLNKYQDGKMKDLITSLFFVNNYDYIVIDIPPLFDNQIVLEVIQICSEIFFITTQDICSLGSFNFNYDFLLKSGFLFGKNKNIILNKYVNNINDINLNEIKKIIKPTSITIIDNHYEDILKANCYGKPLLFYKNLNTTESFENIVEIIYR